MSSQSARPASPAVTNVSPAVDARDARPTPADQREPMARELAADEMPCPVCGAPMPDLKGGKATICPNCGFKDSCCY
jgi:membrane protease subunit (stomatin/prohibitin family)